MAASDKGFFGTLFDFSFSTFVTTKLIKLLYILVIAFGALSCISFGARGVIYGGLGGIVSLVLAPVVFFLWVLIGRVWLELIIVMFRIAEDVGKLAAQGGPAQPAEGTAPPQS